MARSAGRGELVGHRAGFVEELAGGGGAGLHVGELELDPLQVVDRLAEGDPLFRVLVGEVGRALGDADRLRGGAEAGALQRAEGDVEPLADLADHVLLRDPHVGEGRRAGRAALDPELVLERAGVEALAVFLHHEGARCAGSRGRWRRRRSRSRPGPALVIQAFWPLITHSSPSLTAVVRIAAGSEPASGSESAKAGRPLAGRAFRQEALFQLVGAEELDRQRAELLDHQDQGARGARLGDLLDPDLQHQRAGPGAAVLPRRRAARGCPARRGSCGCRAGIRRCGRCRRPAGRSSRSRSGGSFRGNRPSPAGSRTAPFPTSTSLISVPLVRPLRRFFSIMRSLR